MASWMPMASWASSVAPAMWGERMTLSRLKKGDSLRGSWRKTSRAAPATWPDLMASARACSTMSSPRAQLMMRMPFFMMRMEVGLMRPSVWVVRPTWRVR